jgi:hypothetical protein
MQEITKEVKNLCASTGQAKRVVLHRNNGRGENQIDYEVIQLQLHRHRQLASNHGRRTGPSQSKKTKDAASANRE